VAKGFPRESRIQWTLIPGPRSSGSLLKETGGPFLAGDTLTLDDMALAPKLYHVKV
jgi:glutathione S-transferase